MKRRDVIVLLGLSMASPAAAQMPQPSLGLLSFSELADGAIKPFRAGLEQGGYIEGKNLFRRR